jgi:chaperonin cofactor prefoldin
MSEDSIHNEFMARLSTETPLEAEATPESFEEPVEGDPENEEVLEDGIDNTVDTEGELDPDTEAEEGDPVEGETPEVSAEYTELEEKYKSLEQEFSRVTANRKEIERSLDEAKSKASEALYAIEDKFGESEQIADYFVGMANQQLQQLQGINPATLTQEQFGQYQQAYQQAQMQVQQHNQLIEQIKTERDKTRTTQKEREAEIARERLKVRIPDWSGEKYRALGELAGEYGYSETEFFDSTDHRLILLLNEVATGKEAAKVVEKKVTKTKTKPPRTASARPQDRNERGQFQKAQREFAETRPGTKGSFAQMKAAQLRSERSGK